VWAFATKKFVLATRRMHGDLARRLDLPIARLECPRRLRWVIETRGIETIRDLVALSPEQVASVRRCGRKTLIDTDRALHALLGVSWREAHAATATVTTVSLDAPLAGVAYPARLKWLVAARGLRTLRELVRLTPSDVLATRNCGPRTVEAVDAAVRSILGTTWSDARARAAAPQPLEVDWETTLRSLVATLDDESAVVAGRRLGAAGPAEPVDVVARALGFSTRRTRRIEHAAIDRVRADPRAAAARGRLRAAVDGGAVRLADLGARDPFFHADPARLDALAIFVDVLLAGPARTRRVGPDLVVSTLDASDIAWRVQRLRETARRSTGVALVDDRLVEQLGWSRTLARDLVALADLV